ncbi:hypothetical protein H6F75_15920 [Nodosilinea sp. FACHB-131]|uniref:hypothetical protein n=1 Tax=Cyanophyceae TaxID=3028117 RepID=UPI0016882636|nr:hypothetical protein [Nodosilinea sp. FACHB-131]MBD1874975.1 hypothetical protein [Nodosilinea sp. FACHB-131]
MEEHDLDLATVELSLTELDEVSGGLDIFISGSIFDQSEGLLTQSGGCGCPGSMPAKTSNTSSGTFQFAGLGFESVDQIFAVFAGLSRLFGR